MLESVKRLLGFVGDMNETEINDHIKARSDGFVVSFRIDNEWLDGWNRAVLATVEKIEKEVAERYMELPLDADGVPIRVDDCLEYIGNGERVKVCGVRAGEICYYDTHGRLYGWTPSTMYRHHHEPTVEDVLREMHAKLDEVTALYVGEAIDLDERDSDEARIFAEYAAKLQLREVDE